MHPIVHPVVGYLCYAAYTRGRHGERPGGEPTVVAVFAAVLPDLVDQPLRLVGVMPVGRTIAHSLLVAIPVVVAVGAIARRRGRPELGVAFAIGYLSHIAADVPWHVLAGDVDELGFLLFPITRMPQYTGTKTLATAGGVEITTLWIEAVLFVVGVRVWWNDGRPGLELFRR